jgi:hypothetical protein
MAMTKAERKAAQAARDRVRRYEFMAQLAAIESANTTREELAKREARGERIAAWLERYRRAQANRDLIGG